MITDINKAALLLTIIVAAIIGFFLTKVLIVRISILILIPIVAIGIGRILADVKNNTNSKSHKMTVKRMTNDNK